MTPDLRDRILELARQPENTASLIAAAVGNGVTRNSVIGLCRRNGIKLGAGRESKNSVKNKERKYPNWTGGIGARAAEPRQPSGRCRWIDGDPRKPGWRYCDEPVSHAGSAWCPDHRRRVYTTARTPEQQAAIDARMARARAARAA